MTPLIEAEGLTKHFDLGRNQTVHAVDRCQSRHCAARDCRVGGRERGPASRRSARPCWGLLDKTAGQVRFQGEAMPDTYTPGDFQRYAQTMQMIFQDPYSSPESPHDRGRDRWRRLAAAYQPVGR